MAATYGNLPFGLRKAVLFPLSGSGIDLPVIRSLDVSITSDSTDLTGDDTQVAVHTFNTHVEGSVESGGINPAAIALIIGGAATVTGTGGTAKTVVSLTDETQGAYFKIEAQVIGDDSGDLHIVIYKAKATSGPNWTFQGGEYTLTTMDYTGVFDTTAGAIMDLVFNATAVAIDTSP